MFYIKHLLNKISLINYIILIGLIKKYNANTVIYKYKLTVIRITNLKLKIAKKILKIKNSKQTKNKNYSYKTKKKLKKFSLSNKYNNDYV